MTEKKVVIVGGGISGLTSAFYLQRSGLKTVVLEACSEIGGRTRSILVKHQDEELSVSIGGTWSIFQNWATKKLYKDVDCEPEVIQPDIKFVSPHLYYPFLLYQLWCIGKKIDSEVESSKWWLSDTFYDNHQISVEYWMKSKWYCWNSTKQAVREYFLLVENYPSLEEISVSWAALLLYERTRDVFNISGDTIKLSSVRRWRGGTGTFIKRLTEEIRSLGGEVHASSPVKKITQKEGYAIVETPSDQIICDAVIVATAMNTCAIGGIKYEPTLPEHSVNVCQSIKGTQDPALNVILIFDRPFWREPGSKKPIFILPDMTKCSKRGVFGALMDLTEEGKDYGIIRILSRNAFVEGMSEEEIAKSAAEFFSQHFEDEEDKKRCKQFQSFKIFDWMSQMPYIPAVTFHFAIGSLVKDSTGDHIRKPAGRIFFGGSERARCAQNWIEGAVHRGMEVSVEVVDYLEGDTKIISEVHDTLIRADKKRSKTEGFIPSLFGGKNFFMEDIVDEALEDFFDITSNIWNNNQTSLLNAIYDWVA